VRSSIAGVGAGGTVFAAGFFFPMLADVHAQHGRRHTKDEFVSTHMRLYLQGHVTAKGNAGLWLWTWLWAPLQGLPPWLQQFAISP
jgi:hypothetical protein